MTFLDLNLDSFYEGWGDEITRQALMPILRETKYYDRISSYFSIESMLAISEGIEDIWKREGKIRLIMGLHDLNLDIISAHTKSKDVSLDETLTEIKQRILQNVSRLNDEFSKNKIHTFACMLKEGFIELKVAAHPSGFGEAIFHNKRFIFRDAENNVITASSGMNETVRGLTRNYDDLTIQRSWFDPGTQLKQHVESFERLWTGQRPDLIVRDIDNDFAEELVRKTQPDLPPLLPPGSENREGNLYELLKESNEYFFHSMPSVALFPHQERVVQETLGRYPVRKMLADEVGLGKTLEAGAIINFLSQRLTASRICIACPQGLVKQWRDEMAGHFGLDFSIWDSSTSEYESASGVRYKPQNRMPFGKDMPDKVIVSSHLLRTKRHRVHLESIEDLKIDVFVLDEAHAARMSRESSGRMSKTKLWTVAEKLANSATHALLLTATPMQMNFVELYGQLMLLGMEGAWTDPANFETSVQLLAGINAETTLEQCNIIAKLLVDAKATYSDGQILDDEVKDFLHHLEQAEDSFSRALLVDEFSDLAYKSLLALHPAHQLVVRNTRESLIAMGYSFPERVHEAPSVTAPPELGNYFRELESYLRNAYGRVEKAMYPEKSWSVGFAASGYYQRLASSLVASRLTLSRRLHRWQDVTGAITAASKVTLTDQVLEDDDDFDDFDVSLNELFEDEYDIGINTKKDQRVLQAAQIEITALTSLVNNLDSLSPSLGNVDPKFIAALDAIKRLSTDGPVLVFSRYTDTLDGFLNFLEQDFLKQTGLGYGYYSGKQVWLDYDETRLPATKNDVVQALFSGKISLLLCSDAASEGLNLQAASAIINIDVPWNPARLEQRIGRIDRLGQKSDKVHIVNLWYPNSVEAKIYERLLSRKDQLELAIGKYPTLVAKTIADAVSSRLGIDDSTPEVSELELYRDRVQDIALAKLWSTNAPGESQSRQIRKASLIYFQASNHAKALVDGLTLAEGGPKTFTLLHRNLRIWWDSAGSPQLKLSDGEIVGLFIDGRLARFLIQHNQRFTLLHHEVLSEIIGLLSGALTEIEVQSYSSCTVENSAAGIYELVDVVRNEAKLPLILDAKAMRPAITIRKF